MTRPPWIAAALVWCCATSVQTAAQTPPPAQVAVVGTDYAFGTLPATLAAGNTLFSFENRGRVRHEMSVVLLKADATVAQVMEVGLPAGQRLFDRIVGILIARPGQSSGGQLFVDLQPGRTYMIVCTLKDTPEARQHMALGMIASFEVR